MFQIKYTFETGASDQYIEKLSVRLVELLGEDRVHRDDQELTFTGLFLTARWWRSASLWIEWNPFIWTSSGVVYCATGSATVAINTPGIPISCAVVLGLYFIVRFSGVFANADVGVGPVDAIAASGITLAFMIQYLITRTRMRRLFQSQ